MSPVCSAACMLCEGKIGKMLHFFEKKNVKKRLYFSMSEKLSVTPGDHIFFPRKNMWSPGVMGTADLLKNLSLLSHQVNSSLKHAVPDFYANLLVFQKAHIQSKSAIKAIVHIDPLLMDGRELLYNVRLSNTGCRKEYFFSKKS